MKTFNLNNYILVQITEYGWQKIYEYGDYGAVQATLNKVQLIDGKAYYKIQAHQLTTMFGQCCWMAYPSPVEPEILIPE